MKIDTRCASYLIRSNPQRSIVRSKSDHESVVSNQKCFESMPGPRPLPVIGNLWRYLPWIGQYSVDRLNQNASYNHDHYGDLVREVIIGDHCVVHVFDPKHIKSVLLADGAFPQRRSHRALKKYRLEHPHLYSSGGLFPENGCTWKELRDQFSRYFLNQKLVNKYVSTCDQITSDFLNLIQTEFGPPHGPCEHESILVPDFHELLFRWSLEQTGSFALDTRFGCLNAQLSDNAQKLIKSAHLTHEAVAITETGSDAWKYIPTAGYRQLVQAQDTMAAILKRALDGKCDQIRSSLASGDVMATSMLQVLLSVNPKINERDLFTMVVDLFLAGIDTTSFVCAFAIYFLAVNALPMERLRREIHSVVGTATDQHTWLQAHHLKQMVYLRACIQETMRLQPVSIGIGRVLQRPLTLDKYEVPAGTQVILHNQVASRLDKHFECAHEFRPERWLINTGSDSHPVWQWKRPAPVDPFVMLPFGFGPRICLGKKFSELEMQVLLTRMVQQMDCEYMGDGPLGTRTRLINVPDRALELKLRPIKSSCK